ncbi:hypothetical protein [Metallibacterium sp.]
MTQPDTARRSLAYSQRASSQASGAAAGADQARGQLAGAEG